MKLLLIKIILVIGLISLSLSTGFSEEQVTGKFEKYTGTSVTIDGRTYKLCSDVKVFNMKGEKIYQDDLKAARIVKATFKGGCISTVNVLDFWH